MQHAILFDFWQTLVSDSRERRALNKRQVLVAEFLNAKGIETPANLPDAFIAGTERFFQVYTSETRTATLIERLTWIFEYLGYQFSESELAGLVEEVARAGLLLNPQPAEHIREVLSELSQEYLLGIVSDTGFTPGWVLRHHLERHGMLQFFTALSFSDETGRAKPHPKTFLTALEQLETDPANAMHCGDLPNHDVAGARELGITSVLYTGLHTVELNGNQPDYIIADWRELPAIAHKVFVE
jgi:putative hydrolase of the HAD superfamily